MLMVNMTHGQPDALPVKAWTSQTRSSAPAAPQRRSRQALACQDSALRFSLYERSRRWASIPRMSVCVRCTAHPAAQPKRNNDISCSV